MRTSFTPWCMQKWIIIYFHCRSQYSADSMLFKKTKFLLQIILTVEGLPSNLSMFVCKMGFEWDIFSDFLYAETECKIFQFLQLNADPTNSDVIAVVVAFPCRPFAIPYQIVTTCLTNSHPVVQVRLTLLFQDFTRERWGFALLSDIFINESRICRYWKSHNDKGKTKLECTCAMLMLKEFVSYPFSRMYTIKNTKNKRHVRGKQRCILEILHL